MTGEPISADWTELEIAAAELDRSPPACFRPEEFSLPPDRIYLNGNSLGPLPLQARAEVEHLLDVWAGEAVSGWGKGDPSWFYLAEAAADLLAPQLGARSGSIAVGAGATLSIHQLLSTLFAPEEGRDRLLIDAVSFPSDRYAAQSHLRLRGLPPECLLEVQPQGDLLDDDEIAQRLRRGEAGLALLPSVVYTTGQLLDIEKIAAAAASSGTLLILDLSHSAGIMPHHLEAWGVDGAVWAGYKYLNGGPGAPAGLFLHPRHHHRTPGLAGWWGSRKADQMMMTHDLQPACGAGRLQVGTPPLLSLASLYGACRLMAGFDMESVRRRSLELTGFLMRCLAHPALSSFRTASPPDNRRRGGHVAVRCRNAAHLCEGAAKAGLIIDHRHPDLLRLTPSPLFNTARQCLEAARRLAALVSAG